MILLEYLLHDDLDAALVHFLKMTGWKDVVNMVQDIADGLAPYPLVNIIAVAGAKTETIFLVTSPPQYSISHRRRYSDEARLVLNFGPSGGAAPITWEDAMSRISKINENNRNVIVSSVVSNPFSVELRLGL